MLRVAQGLRAVPGAQVGLLLIGFMLAKIVRSLLPLQLVVLVLVGLGFLARMRIGQSVELRSRWRERQKQRARQYLSLVEREHRRAQLQLRRRRRRARRSPSPTPEVREPRSDSGASEESRYSDASAGSRHSDASSSGDGEPRAHVRVSRPSDDGGNSDPSLAPSSGANPVNDVTVGPEVILHGSDVRLRLGRRDES